MALAALHCCRQVDVIGGIHPGTAFTELRFYPPGWVKQFHGRRCDGPYLVRGADHRQPV